MNDGGGGDGATSSLWTCGRACACIPLNAIACAQPGAEFSRAPCTIARLSPPTRPGNAFAIYRAVVIRIIQFVGRFREPLIKCSGLK